MALNRVLTVDDDASLAGVIGLSLRKQGLEALTAANGYDALRLAVQEHPDLVILDIMMPRLDGLETCRRLRQMTDVPVLIVSALTSEADIIKGFEAGADDYLRKPFSLAELNARVRSLLRSRQSHRHELRSSVLRNGDVELDLARRRAFVGGKAVKLTSTEFRLLSYLVQNAGRTLPSEEIVREVWGEDYEPHGGHLKVYICYLRRKLADDPQSPRYVYTIRGVGYYFRDADQEGAGRAWGAAHAPGADRAPFENVTGSA